MDQVRAIAKVLWQQRFWVLSALGTLVAVACWYLASGDLQSRFSSRKNAINGQFSSLEALRREAFHPNEEVIQGNLKQAVDQRESVYQVWSDLYEHQRTEVLYWPKDNVLDDEFVDHMESRRFRDKISSDMRSQYWNYIQKRFDGLLDIVQARKTAGKGGRSQPGGSRFGGMGGEMGGMGGEFGGGMGGGFPGSRRRSASGEEEEDDYLVEWLDQGALQSRLSFAKMPTHDQVWITQEDLWVYETLLHVIAKTNKQRGATRPDNTAVREIVTLQVGRPAIGSSQRQGKIYMPPTEGAAGSSGMGYGGEMGMMGGEGGMMGGEMGMGGGYGGGEMGMGSRGGEGGMGYGGGMGGPRGEGSDVLANRYLDPAGQPISGENLSAEFRQLPVHMILMMDQRWLPQVLLECANAPLPVEVKWLRINPEKSRSTGGRASSGGRRRSSGQQGPLEDSNFATIEIQGVVLIYGEPNKEILNVPGAEEDSEEDIKENIEEGNNELAVNSRQ